MPGQPSFSLQQEFFRKRTLFSFAISLLLIVVFFKNVTLTELVESARGIRPFYVLLAFIAHYASYIFRGMRWKGMLGGSSFSGSVSELAKVTFLFQSVDCVLPAKLGDIYGAHVMKLNFSLQRSFAFGSIVLWRLVDLVFVLSVSVLSAFLLFGNRLPVEILWAIKVLLPTFLLAFTALVLFLRFYHTLPVLTGSDTLRKFIRSFGQGFTLQGRMIPGVLVTTALLWGLEVLRLLCIFHALGVTLPPLAATFVTFSSMLFTAVPLTPAGLGAVELAMRTLLGLVGISGSLLYPIIIWDRFISHWSQILLGVLFVVLSKPIHVKIWNADDESPALAEEKLIHP